MTKPTFEHPFIRYLLETVAGDRAARAILRRTLGRAPGDAPDAFRYVVPWLPNPCSDRLERIYYTVAGLLALHPQHIDEGNMGTHLREYVKAGDENRLKRVEERLEAALRAHPDDLPNHLRRLTGILRSAEIPVNWHALFNDLVYWDMPDQRAKKRWAASFWGAKSESTQTKSTVSE